jgi:hypothetical protein
MLKLNSGASENHSLVLPIVLNSISMQPAVPRASCILLTTFFFAKRSNIGISMQPAVINASAIHPPFCYLPFCYLLTTFFFATRIVTRGIATRFRGISMHSGVVSTSMHSHR